MPVSGKPSVVSAILLSDHVIREANTNKASLIGLFSAWTLPSFPGATNPFWVTVLFKVLFVKDGGFSANVKIKSEDGSKVLFSASGNAAFGADVAREEEVQFEASFHVPAVTIPSVGVYKVTIELDDIEIASVAIKAVSLENKSKLSQAAS